MRYAVKSMRDFWNWVAASMQVAEWEAEYGPAPDGMAWSGEWRPAGNGGLTFVGCTAVPVPGFPPLTEEPA